MIHGKVLPMVRSFPTTNTTVKSMMHGKKCRDGTKPDSTNTNWIAAEFVQEPGGYPEAQMNENMKVMESLKPVSIKHIKTGYIYY